jgi:hypothetical protein
MKIQNVFVLEDALDDLHEGKSFYNLQEAGVGGYFWDCLISDIESLIIYAGVHSKKFGLHQMFSKRFPYAIYYELVENTAYVVAVLPMRRNPVWIMRKIKKRR